MASVLINPIKNSLADFFSNHTYTSILVLVDNNTAKHCYPFIKDLLPKHKLVKIKSGEEEKNLATCQQIWEAMTTYEMDRHALVINLGGGVIGDMGGFCASTYKRGIDFIQIPTTLLSQVDASVGGKLGIDFNGFKNHIGTFTLPKAVLIDPEFLRSLQDRELKSGFAEIIKHCLIQDKNKWDEIRVLDFEEQNLNDLIHHSIEIKKNIVTQDPTEKGIRKILNFGHTLGHAIETYYLDKGKDKLLHGEAIAAGMICEAFLSYSNKLIDLKTLNAIEEFIFSVYGKVNIKPELIDQIIELTLQDKKNKGKEVKFSLLDGEGSCTFDIVVTKKSMKKALEYYIG